MLVEVNHTNQPGDRALLDKREVLVVGRSYKVLPNAQGIHLEMVLVSSNHPVGVYFPEPRSDKS